MDALFCDELLEEIFRRLPPATVVNAISLVSKRWLRISRSSTTSLSLRFFNNNAPLTASSFSLISFLSAYPFLTSLSLLSPDSVSLLLAAASSCPALTHLRLFTPPISTSSVYSLSTACANLISLNITVSRTFNFTCFTSFPRLNDLSISFFGESGPSPTTDGTADCDDGDLPVESLSVSGIRYGDRNVNWLWRSCKRLRILKLKCCEALGDRGSVSCLDSCFPTLYQVELRTCRTIVDVVLSKLAEVSYNLNSLTVYDGGSRQGLLHFITTCKSNLQRLDFRLPLDLDDDHLYALTQNSTALASLRLQSCCLVTGQGLKSLVATTYGGLQELALVSCDVVERESGLLTSLGQNLKMLRTLDLSYNEMLQDKEFVYMLGSCGNLNDLKLRECRMLSNAALVSISRNCKQLRSLDIVRCWKLEAEFVEIFVLSSPSLGRIVVEESKITDVAKLWIWRKSIDHVFA